MLFVESFPIKKINFNDVEQRFGPPGYVKSLLAKGPDGDYYILEMYYPQNGLAIKLTPDQNSPGKINPSTAIHSIQYYPPGNILSYLILLDSCDMSIDDATKNADEELELIKPWKGIDNIEVIETR